MNSAPHCEIDHIAVTAPDLESGSAWVHEVLGVMPQPGGEHPLMGTHNRLLRLGESVYLEVITVNPAAPAPERPRWFGLDRLAADAKPGLHAWVARTHDISATLAAAGEPLGTITDMQRGALQWQMTIPDKGKPPLSSIAPALIEWKSGPHPASTLEDHGLRLVRLELRHPRPHRVAALMQAIGMGEPVEVRRSPVGRGASLIAHIETRQGLRELSVQA